MQFADLAFVPPNKSSGFDQEIQPAPKARQKVARDKREARSPWKRSDKTTAP